MQRRFHIILNYRRADTSAQAGRLYDDLVDRFGEDQVFMDIDAIEPGVDFADVIERAVGSASVFLSVIGPGWLSAVDAKGARRLDKPDDFVRMEIEAALRPEVRVIPVLVHNAAMPSAEELPPSLAPLARRNAIELRDNSWRYDVGRLIETIERVREGEPSDDDLGAQPVGARAPLRSSARARARPPGEPTAPRRPKAWTIAAGIAAVLVLAVVIGLAVSWLSGDGGEPRVSIGRVDAEMIKFQPPGTTLAKDALVGTASVSVKDSVRGVEYLLTFRLERRDSPDGPAIPEGSQDMPFVVDKKNDQCSCQQRFLSVSRGKEYRVFVEIYDPSLPTAERLDHAWSNWVQA
jgi:TIR domain